MRQQAVKETASAPLAEIVIASGGGRQVVGHEAPYTARPCNIQDTIEDGAIGMLPSSAVASVGAGNLREEFGNRLPLLLGQIG